MLSHDKILHLQADEDILIRYPEVLSNGHLLVNTVGINFRVKNEHFENNILELRCTAKIADLPSWTQVYKVHLQSFIRDVLQAQNRINNGKLFIYSFYIVKEIQLQK